MPVAAAANIVILKLLKQVENRLCADCESPLGETEAYAVVNHGTWVCKQCGMILSDIKEGGKSVNNVKLAVQIRDVKEVQMMKNAGNNMLRNAILEKHIPHDWTKIRPNSTPEERKLWLQAKYDSMFFLLPWRLQTYTISSPTKPNKPNRDREKVLLPSRIADYFAIVEPKCLVKPVDHVESVVIENLEFTPYISSVYPTKAIDKHTPIPDMISDFIFANGVHLSRFEKPPFFFTYVLTDTLGTKLYGGALHVYELVDPDDLPRLLGLHGSAVSALNKNGQIYYSPKALTVISHYPFFNLFRIFLQQIYHISLSAAPLPIERYIVNFLNDVPLPPLGRTQVNYSIAHETVNITRPPKNTLPMVDFSYVPLFELLSVENILFIFTSLCAERSVCICSDNISILTPICESFLSFLFPFVWQGVYVPIMPLSNVEILEAPIPFLIGLHSQYLRDTPAIHRPYNLVIVDVDNNKILQGIDAATADCYLPPQGSKLKSRLEEFGGAIFHKNHELILCNSGIAFLTNQHMTPISHFAAVDGVSSKIVHASASQEGRAVSAARSFLKSSAPAANMEPLLCTRSSVQERDNGLDPANNVQEHFNAHEVRKAFLRYFVAVLLDYQRFVITNNKIGTESGSGGADLSASHSSKFTFGSMSSLNSSPMVMGKSMSLFHVSPSTSNVDAVMNASTHSSVTSGMNFSSPVFHGEEYIQSHDDLFLRRLLQTQMFEKFVEECAESPNQSEIRFFNESILDKFNRSSTQFTKKKTPFLDDKSDAVTDTYSPPFPSVAGLPTDKRYSYAQFPHLNTAMIGPLRPPKVLVTAGEVIRSTGGQGALLSGLQSTSTFRSKKIDTKIVLFEAKSMYRRVMKVVIKCQARFRMRKHRRAFNVLKGCVRVLQKLFRRRLRARRNVDYFIAHYLVRVQSLVRMCICRRRYLRMVRSAVVLQAVWRMFTNHKAYNYIRRKCIRIQAFVRMVYAKRRFLLLWKKAYADCMKQVLILWDLVHIPLIYRSYFWTKFDGKILFHLIFVKNELKRLCTLMGYRDITSTYRRSFENALNSVHNNQFNRTNVANLPEVVALFAKEKDERKRIYLALKGLQTKEKHSVDAYFVPFGLQSQKKRKQTLSNQIWVGLDHVKPSVDILTKLLGQQFPYPESGVESFANEVQARLLSEISRASFAALRTQVVKRMLERQKQRMTQRQHARGLKLEESKGKDKNKLLLELEEY